MVKHAILFVAFNRLEEALISFKAIEEYKPPRLYLAIDGPREQVLGEAERIAEIREALLLLIKWPCQVYKRFPDNNLGCKDAVSSAIDWVFEQEEEIIIIEDDCLANSDFFKFCDHNLEKFRDNHEIWHIAGYCRGNDNKGALYSYRFSILGSIWGWATWKRAWQHYCLHPDLSKWKGDALNDLSWQSGIPIRELKHRMRQLQNIQEGKMNTWDFQWSWCKIIHQGLTISPYHSLVANIGLENGTHQMDSRDLDAHTLAPLKQIIDPPSIQRDLKYEQYFIRPSLTMRFYLRLKTWFR